MKLAHNILIISFLLFATIGYSQSKSSEKYLNYSFGFFNGFVFKGPTAEFGLSKDRGKWEYGVLVRSMLAGPSSGLLEDNYP